ncbi:hypothetical protein [Aromatoleum anaerobium]|uniref:hypothetical protein n=1 Tax=Aromatoleum anaerobium TaxID=182180 RepID=UPI00145E34A9|nr:hypothetical protein [Aromatoleum anaerobium]MCK0506126.1 hypothetical protein [Aromatoleum anaerobium]
MFAIPWAFLIVLLVRQRAKDGFFIPPQPGIIVAPSSTAKLPAASCRLAGAAETARIVPHGAMRRSSSRSAGNSRGTNGTPSPGSPDRDLR